MAEPFVALAESLRATQPVAIEIVRPAEPDPVDADAAVRRETLMRELHSARLAAFEAYERAVPRLLEALAREVLGRELATAPADLSALAAALQARFRREEPVALIVAPCDALSMTTELPVRVDPVLQRGDLILDVRDGEIDARFELRIAAALAACAAGVP